jgi:hypothetical protein
MVLVQFRRFRHLLAVTKGEWSWSNSADSTAWTRPLAREHSLEGDWAHAEVMYYHAGPS